MASIERQRELAYAAYYGALARNDVPTMVRAIVKLNALRLDSQPIKPSRIVAVY